MQTFQVQLTLTITAPDSAHAFSIGLGACEHLVDTYNDDGSIDQFVGVKVLPEKVAA
jgi:hypothetical protein